MKKRIVCFLLTLIMLVSLAPAATLTASAATLKTSESAITLLKQFEGYSRTCYPDGFNRYSIGYGTICSEKHTGSEKHTITETVADKALREEVAKLDTAVNKFASSNGLSLKQNQHDALVIFSYNCGSAWMNGTGVFRSAVVNKATGNKFLNAICMWDQQANPDTNLMKRRMAEANLYLNGVYSNSAPSNYTYVVYRENGGKLTEGDGYRQYYDTTLTTTPEPVPTKSGATFKGWYTAATNGVRITELSAKTSGQTLYAVWQQDGKATNVNYSLSTSRINPKTVYQNDRKTEWTEQTAALKNKSTVTIDEDYIGSDGTLWCHISGSGWVKVSASQTSSSTSGTKIDVMVTVTNSYVNYREKANIYGTRLGAFNQGDKLRIIDYVNGSDGFLWGQVAKSASDNTPVGWVALMYTNYNTVKDSGTTSTGTTSKAVAKATVVCSNYVNVRSDAGTANKIVGALANGNQVDIYEIKNVNGHQWGRTDSGWFCLTYAKVTMLSSTVADATAKDPNAIAYAFIGYGRSNAKIYTDADGATLVKNLSEGAAVTITQVKLGSDGKTWGKTSDGWISLEDLTMGVAKYLVVSDTLNVREGAGTEYTRIDKLSKGVELEISKIQVVGTEIWGYAAKYNATTGEESTKEGWVNLASSYVQRTNAPAIKDESSSSSVWTATIVGADKVNVRASAAVTGKFLGQISRGTTAKVLDKKDGWYLLDYKIKDGYESWVYKDYVDTKTVTTSTGSSSTGSNTATTSETGNGIIANTYSGVNIRTGAGTAYPSTGKILPGTAVEILETKLVGTTKWGRVTQGWICMDYVAMISYDDIPGYNGGNNGSSSLPDGSITVDSYDKVESSSTTAVYTGKVTTSVAVCRSAELSAEKNETVRTLNVDDTVTIHELLAVTTTSDPEKKDDVNGSEADQVVTTITYWARVNDGYIRNPQDVLKLNALSEVTYTLTGSDTLNIRSAPDTNDSTNITGKLTKGDKVTVTKLEIKKDKVWGWIETENGSEGWARLDYMAEGAYYVNQTTNNTNPATPSAPVMGSTGNTGSTGVVNNTSGYKYTGKVINVTTTPLKARATASTTAAVNTTLNNGAALVIYETTIAEGMAWGRCDAGWVYLYYVDLTPSGGSAIDARVVYNDNTIIYTDSNCSEVAGTYAKMSVIDIYEVVGKMARTDQGWVNTDNLL